MRALGPAVAIIILVALLVSGALYTVDQRQHAIVFQLGEVKDPVDIARVRAALQTALMRERIATRRRSRG